MPWKEMSPVNLRMRLVLDAIEGPLNMSELAEQHGISRKTAYKWLGRVADGGPAALEDRSHAARWVANRTPKHIEDLVVALRGQHAEHTLTQEDRNDDARLRRLQLLRFGAVKQAHWRSISVPAPDQLRRRRPDHLAGKALAERERAARVFDAAVHLAHDVHGLARLVVRGEKKGRGIHCACGLVVERTE